jgi:hypothetical protein
MTGNAKIALRRVDAAALIKGEPFVALRVGTVFGLDGKELPGNITDVSQLHAIVQNFRTHQEPHGDYPLIDFDHAATGPMAVLAHPERSIPLGAIIDMKVEGDGLLVTPGWTKRGRRIMDAAEGLLYPSAHYAVGTIHDRATGEAIKGAYLKAVAMTPDPATRPDQLGAVRSAADAPEGVGVVYRLPPDVAGAWPTIPGADGPDGGPHVTLAYLKVPPAAVESVKAALRQTIPTIEPFRLMVTGGVHAFGPDDEGRTPVVAAVQSEGAVGAHQALLGAVRAARLPAEQTHRGFVPHATVGYVRGDYESPAMVAADLTVDTLEIWHGDGEPEPVRMKQAPGGATNQAARSAGGKPMSFEEMVAKLGLTPEQAAELKAAALAGGDAARAAEEPAAAAAPSVAAPMADPALRSLQADFKAFKAKVEAESTVQEETALINEQIKRDAALPAEEPLMRLALRARATDGGAAWKLFTDRPNGQAYRSAGGGVTGQRTPTTQADDKTPPRDRNGFAAFALRNAQQGEDPFTTLCRVRKAFPEQSRAAFGDRGIVDDSPIEEVR